MICLKKKDFRQKSVSFVFHLRSKVFQLLSTDRANKTKGAKKIVSVFMIDYQNFLSQPLQLHQGQIRIRYMLAMVYWVKANRLWYRI